MKTPHKAIMLATMLLAAGKKGCSRKEMVTALLKANGQEYDSKKSGYGSVSFFTPCKEGVGGVYWENDESGRYHITALGRRLVKTGTAATAEEKDAARKVAYAKRSASYAAKVKSQPIATPKGKELLAVTMPNEDWHVICGWIESLQQPHMPVHVATSAKELAAKLRSEYFPVHSS